MLNVLCSFFNILVVYILVVLFIGGLIIKLKPFQGHCSVGCSG